MAAVAFFYAGTMENQWQLLIVLVFLFFGTLAFFAVLFDENGNDDTTSIIVASVQDNDNDGYQSYSASIA